MMKTMTKIVQPNDASDSKPIDALWKKWENGRDPEVRNDILMHYIGLVKRTVKRLYYTNGSYHDYDDLYSCGVLGLMDAVERFVPKEGAKFETYAKFRIKGEIIDYMRKQDWVPVHTRQRMKELEATYETIAHETGKMATDEAVAERLGIPMSEVQRLLGEMHTTNVLSYEDLLFGENDTDRLSNNEFSVDKEIESKVMKDLLVEQLGQLSDKERLILNLYYQEELTFKEIGRVLQLTESRISQIHSSCLVKMRSRMKAVL